MSYSVLLLPGNDQEPLEENHLSNSYNKTYESTSDLNSLSDQSTGVDYKLNTRNASSSSSGSLAASRPETLPSLSQLSFELSYTDLVAATCDFSFKIGKGACGTVYWGELPGGTEIAVKVLKVRCI